MAISQRRSEIIRSRRRATERNDPEFLCARCGGARVEAAESDRAAYACPNCARTHTRDGEQYEPPEVRQYSHSRST